MKLAHKIYLVIAICTLPLIGLSSYFVLTGINKDIDFAEMEIKGDEYQRVLENLLDHMSQHQLLAQSFISGDKSVTSQQLSELKALIAKDFERLTDVDAKYGKDLQFTPEALKERHRETANVTDAKQAWKALSTQEGMTAAASKTKHFELITTLRDMISHSGDKSNLILDPDLDSYYMMDITLGRLPAQQERLARSLSDALEVVGRSGILASDTRKLDTYSALLKEVDRDSVQGDMKTALDEDKNFYGVSPSLQQNLRPKVEAFASATDTYASLLEGISSDKGNVDAKKLIDAGEQARRDSFQLWDTSVNELDTLLKIRIQAFQAKRLYALLIALAILLAAATLAFVIIRTITRSVESVANELKELATGDADLTRRITVTGSRELQTLAHSFNTLMGKLLELMKQIQQSGTQVTSSSNEIAASTKQLEAAVTEQAASTNEVVATTKEISATSQSLVHTMSDVGKVASDTASLAGSAQGDLDGMDSTMRQLAGSTTSISTKLAAISDKANNINKIVITITKVADQTNLLSLNASIEAEKAGEHGLGFAVVAREIRRLADQTAVATLDIERMVKEMQSAVSIGVMEMDKFTKDVGRGVDDVNQISTQMAKMMEQVQALAPRFETVTEGMQAQSQGAQQISTAMVQLSDAARQTMDSLRQTNSAIMDLNSAAHGLHDEVARFRTTAR